MIAESISKGIFINGGNFPMMINESLVNQLSLNIQIKSFSTLSVLRKHGLVAQRLRIAI